MKYIFFTIFYFCIIFSSLSQNNTKKFYIATEYNNYFAKITSGNIDKGAKLDNSSYVFQPQPRRLNMSIALGYNFKQKYSIELHFLPIEYYNFVNIENLSFLNTYGSLGDAYSFSLRLHRQLWVIQNKKKEILKFVPFVGINYQFLDNPRIGINGTGGSAIVRGGNTLWKADYETYCERGSFATVELGLRTQLRLSPSFSLYYNYYHNFAFATVFVDKITVQTDGKTFYAEKQYNGGGYHHNIGVLFHFNKPKFRKQFDEFPELGTKAFSPSWYVLGGGGVWNPYVHTVTDTTNVLSDKGGMTWTLPILGVGYQFHRYYAAELGMTWLRYNTSQASNTALRNSLTDNTLAVSARIYRRLWSVGKQPEGHHKMELDLLFGFVAQASLSGKSKGETLATFAEQTDRISYQSTQTMERNFAMLNELGARVTYRVAPYVALFGHYHHQIGTGTLYSEKVQATHTTTLQTSTATRNFQGTGNFFGIGVKYYW